MSRRDAQRDDSHYQEPPTAQPKTFLRQIWVRAKPEHTTPSAERSVPEEISDAMQEMPVVGARGSLGHRGPTLAATDTPDSRPAGLTTKNRRAGVQRLRRRWDSSVRTGRSGSASSLQSPPQLPASVQEGRQQAMAQGRGSLPRAWETWTRFLAVLAQL